MKNSMIALCLSMLVCVLSLAISIIDVKNTDAIINSYLPIIIIDAGHGGEDGGAVSENGINEKDINLEISLKLNEILSIMGYETKMVRTTDVSIHNVEASTIRQRKNSDLKNRKALMDEFENCIYVSVHQNKFDDEKIWGAQTFYSPNNEESKILANFVQNEIVSKIQPTNKRVIKKSGTNIYVLYQASKPAIMVECGFISNENELEQLLTSDYQSKIAFSIMSGVTNYYISEVTNGTEV